MGDSTIYKRKSEFYPFQYTGVWVAFIIGGGPILFLMVINGIFNSLTILNFIFLTIWIAYITILKGAKWSFLLGFLIALAITSLLLFWIYII